MEHDDPSTDLVLDTISAHVEKHIGKIDYVFHPSPGPQLIHIDVLHVLPTRMKPFHKLITCGMSRRPMCPPEDASEFRWAELYLCLPPDWFGPMPGVCKIRMWPVHALGELALMPHIRETWLWHAHTVSGPDRGEPIAPGVEFTAWIIGGPSILTREGCRIRMGEETVYLMSAVPIYEEELEFALERGSHALFERMEAARVTALIDPKRLNCMTGRRPMG